LLATIAGLVSNPAFADFRLCNNTSSQVGIAVGYKGRKDWVTTGWLTLGPHNCGILLPGKLSNRFYYVRAVDYDGHRAWIGKIFMCSSDKEFSTHGTEECSSRGYERTAFLEVDTRDRPEWTVQIGKKAPENRSFPDAPNTDVTRP
jgi:uncharacterized membrane protein